MSLAHHTIRNILANRNLQTSFYSVSKQNLGCRRLHSLHKLPLRQERKLSVSSLAKFDNGPGCFSRNTAAVFILTRNESTNSTASHISNSTTGFNSAANITEDVNKIAPASPVTPEGTPITSQETVLSSTTSETVASVSETSTAVPTSTTEALVFESIPDAPAIPVEQITEAVLVGGEPTFASLGLGGWYPTGIVQQCLEFFHINLGMPWWASILTGTIIVRVLLFPLVVKSQRNAARMQNHMPEIQTLQLKMTEARQMGNALMSAKYANEMMQFMKEKDISPFKSMLVPIAMVPFFMSFFFGLRKMANLPVESLKDGGLFWFTDLTLADPYYILPLITSVTVWVTLEVGADGMKMNAQQHGQIMKYFMRAIPVIMFPFTINFPGALLCYWVSTNAISLVQVSLLKVPAVRDALKIEPLRVITPEMLPAKKKGFKESLKDSWTNMKITREVEDRVRYDEITFKRAGKGPIPKTFKYDPTKVNQMSEVPPTAIQAKRK